MPVLRFLQEYADGIQTGLAIIAGLLGAIWWATRRERMPRAKMDVGAEHVALEDGTHLLRVTVTVENIGHVLIRVSQLKLFVQQLVPTPYVMKEGQSVPFDFAAEASGHEFAWPSIAAQNRRYAKHERPEFEPGESGPLIFEFRLQKLPGVVSVYLHVCNEAKQSLLRILTRHVDIGWTTTRIFHLNHEIDTQRPTHQSKRV